MGIGINWLYGYQYILVIWVSVYIGCTTDITTDIITAGDGQLEFNYWWHSGGQEAIPYVNSEIST